jgi:hypothetical protein
MTVMNNVVGDRDCWEAIADDGGFEKIRPNRDGQMPVSRDCAKHRSYRRSTPHHRHAARPLAARRR